jgi:hypothetical protein
LRKKPVLETLATEEVMQTEVNEPMAIVIKSTKKHPKKHSASSKVVKKSKTKAKKKKK